MSAPSMRRQGYAKERAHARYAAIAFMPSNAKVSARTAATPTCTTRNAPTNAPRNASFTDGICACTPSLRSLAGAMRARGAWQAGEDRPPIPFQVSLRAGNLLLQDQPVVKSRFLLANAPRNDTGVFQQPANAATPRTFRLPGNRRRLWRSSALRCRAPSPSPRRRWRPCWCRMRTYT
jgi:hypothetical protein